MKWWLSVFFLIDGVWVPGDHMRPEGWSPRAYETQQECLERKAYAEISCKALKEKTAWFCQEGKPLVVPPPNMRGREC